MAQLEADMKMKDSQIKNLQVRPIQVLVFPWRCPIATGSLIGGASHFGSNREAAGTAEDGSRSSFS